MKSGAAVIASVVVLATTGSLWIGSRAIVGMAEAVEDARAGDVEPGRYEKSGTEIASLLTEVAELYGPRPDVSGSRDPMVPYTPPKPARAKPRPRRPSYVVTAVVLDENPTAVLRSGDSGVVVRVGDELGDGRVVAIEEDGVTVETDKGRVKYPYVLDR